MTPPTQEDMAVDLQAHLEHVTAWRKLYSLTPGDTMKEESAARRAIHAEKEVERLQSLLKEWQALAERYAPGVTVKWLKEKN